MTACDPKEILAISCYQQDSQTGIGWTRFVFWVAASVYFFICPTNAMAYDLHIEGSTISMSDWTDYIEESDLLTRIDDVSAENPSTGAVISISLPKSAQTADGAIIRPSERDGKLVLTTKYVDEGSVELLKKIVKEIGGAVVGDEGEEY